MRSDNPIWQELIDAAEEEFVKDAKHKVALALALSSAPACTAAQVARIETDASKAAHAAQSVLVAYQNNEASIDEVIAAVAAVTPATGAAHVAATDAVNAAVLLKSNAASVDQVQEALGRVASATAPK